MADTATKTEGIVSVEQFGAKGDWNGSTGTNDTQAFLDTKAFIESNGGTFFVPSNFNCYIPNGVDLFGLRNIKIEGTLTGLDTTKEIIVGVRAAVTLPFKGHVNRLVNLKLKVQGVKNGDLTVNTAPHLLLWADSSVADIDSLAYSNFHLGKVDHFEINSLGTGWINENKIFGGRLTNITIGGSGTYYHNHNVFYSPTLENSTININIGTSNRLLGCRFEGSNTINFGSSTWDNEIVRSWHNAPGSFLRGQARTSFTDNGKGNSC
ncbi:hypothetical protein NKS27_17425 [Peribacillus frigoritolerans]|uniref:hypothetical protein n=1 Tax=Peribacillus frigoritolerans TaxID=450367 RepID=UPI00209E13D3|nr:hypothetical protein [Peribacillus frigoritolerans]MCP1154174.1 hypothetical protein [Peribacillus frigoritolerans]